MNKNRIDNIKYYLAQYGLEYMAERDFSLRFINESNGNSVVLTMKGYEDQNDAIRKLIAIGFISSSFQNIVFTDWPNGIKKYNSYHLGFSDFVCQLKTNVIYLRIEPMSVRQMSIPLYGCPNALIHDADQLKESRRVNIRKYE